MFESLRKAAKYASSLVSSEAPKEKDVELTDVYGGRKSDLDALSPDEQAVLENPSNAHIDLQQAAPPPLEAGIKPKGPEELALDETSRLKADSLRRKEELARELDSIPEMNLGKSPSVAPKQKPEDTKSSSSPAKTKEEMDLVRDIAAINKRKREIEDKLQALPADLPSAKDAQKEVTRLESERKTAERNHTQADKAAKAEEAKHQELSSTLAQVRIGTFKVAGVEQKDLAQTTIEQQRQSSEKKGPLLEAEKLEKGKLEKAQREESTARAVLQNAKKKEALEQELATANTDLGKAEARLTSYNKQKAFDKELEPLQVEFDRTKAIRDGATNILKLAKAEKAQAEDTHNKALKEKALAEKGVLDANERETGILHRPKDKVAAVAKAEVRLTKDIGEVPKTQQNLDSKMSEKEIKALEATIQEKEAAFQKAKKALEKTIA